MFFRKKKPSEALRYNFVWIHQTTAPKPSQNSAEKRQFNNTSWPHRLVSDILWFFTWRVVPLSLKVPSWILGLFTPFVRVTSIIIDRMISQKSNKSSGRASLETMTTSALPYLQWSGSQLTCLPAQRQLIAWQFDKIEGRHIFWAVHHYKILQEHCDQ